MKMLSRELDKPGTQGGGCSPELYMQASSLQRCLLKTRWPDITKRSKWEGPAKSNAADGPGNE